MEKVKTILLNPLVVITIILLIGDFDYSRLSLSETAVYIIEYIVKGFIVLAIVLNPDAVSLVKTRMLKSNNNN